MDGYALVIDISSDEENTRTSTPVKTLPLNLIRTLKISDSSTEVYRGSDAELECTGESVCSPKRAKLIPQKEKNMKVTFNLPPIISNVESDSDDYYEEPESPAMPTALRISQKLNACTSGKKKHSPLNDLKNQGKRLRKSTMKNCVPPQLRNISKKWFGSWKRTKKRLHA